MPPSALYAAEDQWSSVLDRGGSVDFFGSRIDVPTQRRFGDLEAVRMYVGSILDLPFVRARYPHVPAVTVRERRGQARAHYEANTATIAIPLISRWAARESVVLHEVAHHLALHGTGDVEPSTRRTWHGVAFREVMCALVQEALGSEAALLLRAGYEEAGLRTVGTP